MKHSDFGHLSGPIVLFGGPYSNHQALQAMAEVIGDRVAICTGDIVGYCANPNETVAEFRRMGAFAVAGNCEKQLAERSQDCGCGFDDGSACDILSRGWYPFALEVTAPDAVAWLGGLPDIATFINQNRRYAVIHGGATQINRFLWPSSAETDFQTEIAAIEKAVGKIDGVVAGHSGIAFHARIGRHQWINAGAIGLPPHDGRTDTRYVVLKDGEVIIERLAYDYELARAAMETSGLTQGYDKALTTGIWPSEDILPPELRHTSSLI